MHLHTYCSYCSTILYTIQVLSFLHFHTLSPHQGSLQTHGYLPRHRVLPSLSQYRFHQLCVQTHRHTFLGMGLSCESTDRHTIQHPFCIHISHSDCIFHIYIDQVRGLLQALLVHILPACPGQPGQ